MNAARLDAGTRVWVCEKGHVDDHHYTTPGNELCSRCGGAVTSISLDGMASRLRTARIGLEGIVAGCQLQRQGANAWPKASHREVEQMATAALKRSDP